MKEKERAKNLPALDFWSNIALVACPSCLLKRCDGCSLFLAMIEQRIAIMEKVGTEYFH